MNQARLWVIGAAVVAVLVLAGGYFLGVAPQLTAIEAANAQTTSVEAQNAVLEASVASLEKEFATIDTAKADLATLRESVPGEAATSALLKDLNAYAAAAQVTITASKFGDGAPYAPVAAAPAADAQATESDSKDADKAPAETPAEVTGAGTAPTSSLVTAENFVYIPVSLTVAGDYARVLDFVAEVQAGKRLLLVNGVQVDPAAPQAAEVEGEEAPPVTGTPVTTVLNGYIYVLLNDSASPAADAAAAPAADTAAAPAAG